MIVSALECGHCGFGPARINENGAGVLDPSEWQPTGIRVEVSPGKHSFMPFAVGVDENGGDW